MNNISKFRILILSILSVIIFGCASEIKEDLIDIQTNVNFDYQYEYLPTIGGIAFNTGCDYYKTNSLVIDPDFSAVEVEYIRKGIQLWENALGIELGDSISTEDCSRVGREVRNCIVRIDDEYVKGETINHQIFFFMKVLETHGFDERYLEDLAAHELGHYLGLGHIEIGMMDGIRRLRLQPKITDADLIYYAQTCLGIEEINNDIY